MSAASCSPGCGDKLFDIDEKLNIVPQLAFDIDEKLNIVPQLATGFEWTDPTHLVIHLRDGVKFQDGEIMDAAAVKYSLERHLNMPGSFRHGEISQMDHVDVVDPHTVRVVLKAPSAPFLSQLADRAGMIVAPKAAEAAGKNFGLHPVCAGPFSFVERVAQDRIVLERFKDYWNKDAIHFDRVIYQPIADSSVRLANLQAGSIDISEFITPTDTDAVKKNPKLRLVTSDGLGYMGITWNVANGPQANGPLKDPRVRRAFDMAIDRTALMQVVYNGLFSPAAQAVPPESPFYAPGVKPLTRDVAGAKALLQQAGVKTPVSVNLIVPQQSGFAADGRGDPGDDAGGRVRREDHRDGVRILAAERRAGCVQAYILAWSGRVDADGNLWSFLHSGDIQNNGSYNSPTMDHLLDQARIEIDTAKRRALYGQVAALEQTDEPISYLYTGRNFAGMKASITGFRAILTGSSASKGCR